MNRVPFFKYQALGNDFIILDGRDGLKVTVDQVRFLCDRRFGVGADGVIVAGPAGVPEAAASMEFYNSDGSRAQMCGNGIRCLAVYLRNGRPGTRTLAIQTDAGMKRVEFGLGSESSCRVQMGTPSFSVADLPVDWPEAELVNQPIDINSDTVVVTCVSIGNPHCIQFVDEINSRRLVELGPTIERLPIFPKGTNVEFVQVVAKDHLRVAVWERGAGATLACGTGACASVVAAARNGLTARQATVELAGGKLDVCWDEDGQVYLSGPALAVFTGEINLIGGRLEVR